jgi:hypothetical protein
LKELKDSKDLIACKVERRGTEIRTSNRPGRTASIARVGFLIPQFFNSSDQFTGRFGPVAR